MSTMDNIFDVTTHASGPAGRLPLQPDFLRDAPSGHIFGWTQDAAMGWNPSDLGKDEYLILSTQGGIRAEDGSPIALGYHTGHYEVGLLAQAAASEFKGHNAVPFAGFVSDPCDGRTQGTSGMMDSLAYRNDAAIVLRRLIRSLPTRRGVLGIATCDKGLPAMMIALAAQKSLPCVIVPGGVTLLPDQGEDPIARRTLCAWIDHPRRSIRPGMPCLCVAGGRLPIPRDGSNQSGGSRGDGTGCDAFRFGTLGADNLARCGKAIGTCIDRDGSAKHCHGRHCHGRLHS
jgi:hypothetical protein